MIEFLLSKLNAFVNRNRPVSYQKPIDSKDHIGKINEPNQVSKVKFISPKLSEIIDRPTNVTSDSNIYDKRNML
jgi:hypothetical protein